MTERAIKTREQMDPIFNPKSIAVVGATKTPGTVPYDIFHNLLRDEFQGPVYPVSPGSKEIDGVKSYKYIVDIEGDVDLAVLVFPSSVCHLALKQCGEKGVKAAIIISAGFREVGGDGLAREKHIKEIAAQYNIPFIGPNCLGVINTDPTVRLDASFARKMPEAGNIGFLSQSGALCTAVLDYAQAKHIGFSKFISFGNKADVSDIDLLYYLADDKQTDVILMYLEEVTNGSGLMKAARDIISRTGKPILALKSGRSAQGAAAAASHTGSLAGSDHVCDAAFRQAGIIRCHNIEDMFNNAVALAYQPRPKGKHMAIITNAGGPGVLTTDAAIDEGLELAKFSDETTEIFKKELPKTANIKNPVDVIGDARADRYQAAVTAAMADPNVDGVGVILTPQSMTDIEEIAEEVARHGHESTKPLYASFMGEADVASGVDTLQRAKVPHYILPETMCRAFATALRFKGELEKTHSAARVFDDVDTDKARSVLKAAADAGRDHLPVEEAMEVLAAYGLPMVPGELAASADEAAAAGEKLGFPVVMKIASAEVVHKVDVGGVAVGIADSDAAKAAYESIVASVKKHQPEAKIKGVTVQKMIGGAEEVILGIKRDPSFGPVVMFGLGGTFVEIFQDVVFRVAPIETTSVARMVREIKGWPLLSGARGRTPRDVAKVEECIERISQLAVDCPEIKELDMNPLFVLDEGQGAVVVDARIML